MHFGYMAAKIFTIFGTVFRSRRVKREVIPPMATRWPKPEHLFFGAVLGFLLAGLALQLTGLAPRADFWIAVAAFAIAWLPALLAIVFVAIPKWWRRGKAG